MPLELPNLDDRTYDDLVAEAIGMIPTYAPEWTNHNPSDPGITLIELFAHLTEMLLYRQNQVTDEHMRVFLKLINGSEWSDKNTNTENLDLRQEVKKAVLSLRDQDRAITCEDFEALAIKSRENNNSEKIVRAHCVPNRNLESEDSAALGHMSVVIIPQIHGEEISNPVQSDSLKEKIQELKKKVQEYLNDRCLLTTRVHVVEPKYISLAVQLKVILKRDIVKDKFLSTIEETEPTLEVIKNELAKPENNISVSNEVQLDRVNEQKWSITDKFYGKKYTIKREPVSQTSSSQEQSKKFQLNIYEDIAHSQIIDSLRSFFDPIKGGSDGGGFPFGRNIYVSEIYKLLDELSIVDSVQKFEYDLQVHPPNQLPSEGKAVVILAKTNDFYHLRIFDRTGNIVIDRGNSEFVPDETLQLDLDKALANKLIDTQTKSELIPKIMSTIDYRGLDELTTNDNNLLERNNAQHLVAIKLKPNELVSLRIDTSNMIIESPIKSSNVSN